MQERYTDFYDEEGCCLTCEDQEEGCLCFECKCRQCYWYEELEDNGECEYPRGTAWTWEDYEKEAIHIQKIVMLQYDREPHSFSALFSNGSVDKTVFYFYVSDIPHRILAHLENGQYRSLLLKKVEIG